MLKSGGRRGAKDNDAENKAKKANEDDADIGYMLALQEETGGPKKKKARVEAKNAGGDDEDEIDYMLRIQAEACGTGAEKGQGQTQLEAEFYEMQRFGKLMPSDAIDRTLILNGASRPRFVSGAVFRTYGAPDLPESEFCTWVYHREHFVFVVVDPAAGAIRFMDSLAGYSAQTRDVEIARVVSLLQVCYPGVAFAVSEVRCAQQERGSNDCAVFVTNNSLEWLGIRRQVTRTQMADAWLTQFATD